MTQTGPKSKRAKATVRRNAWKHGIRSDVMALYTFEEIRDWEAHLDGMIEHFKPEGHLEHSLVERITIALWKLRRLDEHQSLLTHKHIGETERDLIHSRAQINMILHKPPSDEPIPEDDIIRARLVRRFPPADEMALILRYETHFHRLLIQLLHELEAIQINRKGGTSHLARLDITGAPGG